MDFPSFAGIPFAVGQGVGVVQWPTVSSYAHLDNAWNGYHDWLVSLIRRTSAKRILEVGAGAVPALSLGELPSLGVAEYTLLDISASELEKAPDGYRKIAADICSQSLALEAGYDLVISRALAEHIRIPRRFHQNIYNLLTPGGRAFHFFPTLFWYGFLLNRIIPENIGGKLLRLLTPDRTVNGHADKFPAYYRWTYGPLQFQIRRFERLGYEIETYNGFFGHGYYNRIPIVRDIHSALTRWLIQHPIPALTTNAYLVLRRPV